MTIGGELYKSWVGGVADKKNNTQVTKQYLHLSDMRNIWVIAVLGTYIVHT